MSIVYREEDGDLNVLAGKTVGVIGYGNLGRAMALNLRDSGIAVCVGERDQARQESAADEGFTLMQVPNLVQQTDIIMLLVPDEAMPQIYLEQVSPYLSRGDMLVFASAYNVAFGYIEAPPFIDVGLIAPRTLAVAVRERFEQDEGFYSFLSVGQDSTGNAWETVLALAKAVGTLRKGGIEIAFERETELDLFVQQAVMPALHHIMVTAAQLLIEEGYAPEAIFTDLYLSGELQDYLKQASQTGLVPALRSAPITNQYGTFTRMERFDDMKLQRLMEVTLKEIREGTFAQEWTKERNDGYHRLRKLMNSYQNMEIWEWEQQALDMLHPFREDNGFE
ncbi:MAG: NAD(P)-binding domain-containing protein [Anaerolineae bacterium]|nr:NAD(P)-binding domain-containing protein [Anaerolineae bacterium]